MSNEKIEVMARARGGVWHLTLREDGRAVGRVSGKLGAFARAIVRRQLGCSRDARIVFSPV